MMNGLTAQEATELLQKYGPNELPEKKRHLWIKIARWFISPISLMLLLAAVLSFGSGKPFDGYFILFLILVNATVTLWQEKKADDALEKLKEHFHTIARVYRDGSWVTIPAGLLVPRDTVELEIGSIVPADVEITDGANVSVNESALTGESLPTEKLSGALVYSGSFMVTGRAIARVQATGAETYFGKTLKQSEGAPDQSILEKDILRISFFLSVLSLIAVVILTVVLYQAHAPFLDILTLDLSLVIAGIPISLPTVMTLIISLGVVGLAAKQAVVRRLASLEDLANVNLLFSDKTGTLTRNLIEVERIVAYGVEEEEVLRMAYLTAEKEDHDPINKAIRARAVEYHIDLSGYIKKNFIPADSTRKHSTTSVLHEGKVLQIEVGAPQVIFELSRKALDGQFLHDVEDAATQGFRALVVAVSQSEKSGPPKLIGMLLLSDTLREDSKEVVEFLGAQGVEVSMVTGDHRAIAERVGAMIGIPSERIYAEVLPIDKFNLVKAAKEKGYIVAVTGDGVNDLPAVKVANVGIAVSGAVDALKSTADIVLLAPGIGVIKDAIIESRKIFSRLWTYSIYRISESFRVIITIAVLGLIYHSYPLLPVQLILLALLNDIPIIALAYDRVRLATSPAHIDARKRIFRSTLFGFVGVANSLLMFLLLTKGMHMDWGTIQSMFFLKLTVSGHLLIYLAHTEERWWKFLPSKQVIIATSLTQLLATCFAALGLFMHQVPWGWILFVWLWSFVWMQVGEFSKHFARR